MLPTNSRCKRCGEGRARIAFIPALGVGDGDDDGDAPAADGDSNGPTCAGLRRARMMGQGHLKESWESKRAEASKAWGGATCGSVRGMGAKVRMRGILPLVLC